MLTNPPIRPSEYIYLASPYSHIEAAIREERFLSAELCAVWLLRRRNWVYSPIVHCHAMAQRHNLPTDFSYWQDYNRAMLLFARSLYVLCLPSWRESKGVKGEIEFAQSEGICLRYIEREGEDYVMKAKP